MINAALVAMEFNASAPRGRYSAADERATKGFFHLCGMKGDVEHAELHYIVRDHDRATFEARKKLMELAREGHQRKIRPQRRHPHGSRTAITTWPKSWPTAWSWSKTPSAPARQAGMKPFIEAVRGGTDGCRLSYIGSAHAEPLHRRLRFPRPA